MTKAFNFIYTTNRKNILLSLLSLYILTCITEASTLTNRTFWLISTRIVVVFVAVCLVFFLICDFINKRFKITLFLLFGVCCAIGNLIFVKTTILCFLLAFLYVLKGIDFKDIAKISAFTLLSGLAINIFLAIVGFIDNPIHSRGDINRFTFGFNSAVCSSLLYMCACFSLNYYKKNKNIYILLLIEAVINVLLYYYTNTRVGFVLTWIVIIGSLVYMLLKKRKTTQLCQNCEKTDTDYQKNEKFNKIFSIIVALIPLIMVIGFSILVILYGGKSDFILKLDQILSGRISLTFNALKEKPLTLFGKKYDWFIEGQYIGVDSAFFHYLVNLGIFPTIFILFIAMFLLYKSFREKKYWLFFIILLIVVDSLIDSLFFDLRYNIFLLSLIEGCVGEKMIYGKNFVEKNVNININKTNSLKNFNKKLFDSRGKITAVVVTYNRKELLKECLQALLKIKQDNFNILIVDNASTDGTFEYIENELKQPNVCYQNTGANLGGAGGFNFGIRKAVENGADYVWIMDDDCIVQNDSLDALLKFAEEKNNNFGFLSSVVKWTDGSICAMNKQKVSISKSVTNFNESQKVMFASFVSMFINVEVIEDVGLPIKDFFIWGDDWEYSSRISKNYDCYLVADSIVLHKCKTNIGSNLSKDESERLDRYFYAYRNEGYMYSKMGYKGKLYFFLKKLLHKFRIHKSKSIRKKGKIEIMKKGLNAIKDFDPAIEYCYRPTTKVQVCECFAAEEFFYGGQEEFLINMLNNFDMNKCEYTFFTPFKISSKKLQKLIEAKKIRTFNNNRNVRSIFRKFYTITGFKKFLKKANFDVIHIHSGSLFALAIVCKIAKKAKIKKVIVHSHNTGTNNLKSRLMKKYTDKILIKYADVYLACSKLAGQFKFPKKIIDAGKCTVIKNGIETEKFKFNEDTRKNKRKELGLKDELTILNVGRFSEQKNHKFLIEIIDKLHNNLDNFKVILVGEGELKEEILKEISDKGLDKYFIILEKRSDIPEIMMASDVFILPSLFEGFPVVGIESQSSGLPTLCSTTITNEVNITNLCKQLDIDSEEEWVKELLKTKVNALERSLYAQKILNAGFDAKQSAEQLEKIYLN